MKKRVLFVSHTASHERPFLDPSTRYRCFTPAAALRRRGHHTAVVSQKLFEESPHLVDDFDAFVFHRPMLTETLAEFLEARRKQPAIIVDFDDLIFDVAHSHLMPRHRFGGQSLSATAQYLAANAAACSYFASFSASTTPLVERLSRLFGARLALVTSNALEEGYAGTAASIREHTKRGPRPYKFGYFSGTASHDGDLASVAPALAEALSRFSGSRMLVLGPVAIPKELLPYGDRIDRRTSVVPFYHLPYVMAQVETAIAPLEWNDFTTCKSGLKFFEAAVVGCTVVATPIPDIDRFESPMLRKCRTEADWSSALADPFDLSDEDTEAEIERVLRIVDSERVAQTWDEELLP